MEIRTKLWGTIQDKPIDLLTIIDNKSGFEVQLTNIGASIVVVKTPDRTGKLEDIHYGRNSPQDYFVKDNAHFGSTVGRVASLTAFSQFTVEGQIIKLTPTMMNVHHIHGGHESFSEKIWTTLKADKVGEGVKVIFQYISLDGEEGYPGRLITTATYTINPFKIEWEYRAMADKPTICNLTNHAYWNLDGLHKVIDDQQLQIFASNILGVKSAQLAIKTLGNLFHLSGPPKISPFFKRPLKKKDPDFRQPRLFKDVFKRSGDIDTNFFLDGYETKENPRQLIPAAELYSPTTGRKMKIETSEPVLVVYSGNNMGKVSTLGQTCLKHGAICIEAMKPTDCIHIPELSEWVLLRAGQEYYSHTVHSFEVQ